MADESTAIVVAESVELGVVQASNPQQLIARATEAADVLAAVIESRKLYSNISGKRYVRVEGWTTLATMLGVMPREVSNVTVDDVASPHFGRYIATVELVRMTDGAVLTSASAECGRDEPTWAKRSAYARRSMATTRATSKACRIAFSWIMVLAGFEATPSEEIPREAEDDVARLPGDAKKWDGHGGKALSDVPSDVLSKARKWLVGKDDKRNAGLIEAIDDVLESRRPDDDKAGGAS